MRLSNTPPAGAGQVRRTTKTDRLLKAIDDLGHDKATFLPVGIRVGALAEITGVPVTSITTLLAPHVQSGRVCVCKITSPGTPAVNEYRKGSGVPAPDFKPLNTKRAGIALGAPAHPGGTATAAALSTPRRGIDAIETPVLAKQQPQPAVGTATPAAGAPVLPRGEPAVAAAPATPTPVAGAALKKEPAARKASAGDAFRIALDADGTLLLADEDGVMELDIARTLALGDFLHATQGVWRP